jgi:anaphase-promoting complex subunit 1
VLLFSNPYESNEKLLIRTNNEDAARRLALPSSTLRLAASRPDLLLFRALGCALILWDRISPTEQWMGQQIPSALVIQLENDVTSQEEGAAASSWLAVCAGLGNMVA